MVPFYPIENVSILKEERLRESRSDNSNPNNEIYAPRTFPSIGLPNHRPSSIKKVNRRLIEANKVSSVGDADYC